MRLKYDSVVAALITTSLNAGPHYVQSTVQVLLLFLRCSPTTEEVAIGILQATSTINVDSVPSMADTFADLHYAAPSRFNMIRLRFQISTANSRDRRLALSLRDIVSQARDSPKLTMKAGSLHAHCEVPPVISVHPRKISLLPCGDSRLSGKFLFSHDDRWQRGAVLPVSLRHEPYPCRSSGNNLMRKESSYGRQPDHRCLSLSWQVKA